MVAWADLLSLRLLFVPVDEYLGWTKVGLFNVEGPRGWSCL